MRYDAVACDRVYIGAASYAIIQERSRNGIALGKISKGTNRTF